MEKASVLIATEGTYPCYSGGVSVWCDYLIRELAEADFHIFALTHAPAQSLRFALPPNVVSCTLHPIWATEEPGSSGGSLLQTCERKMRTTEDRIHSEFLPAFKTVIDSVFSRDPDPAALGTAFLRLYRYCREYDYTSAGGSRGAWEVFYNAAARSDLGLTLEDATLCLRWTLRNLSVLAAEFPEVDLVHSSIATTAGIAGVICKLRSGSAYLLTEHGLHLRELYLSLSRCSYSLPCRAFLLRFYTALTRLNYHYADRITALGEFNQRWQIQLGANSKKLVIVPNGVNADRFHPPAEARSGPPVILTMARIAPIKGIEPLIRAAALVHDRAPEVKFRILGEVGDAIYQRHCLQLVEQFGLGSTIEFGCTEDSSAAYRDADIFCLPSLSEALPFAVIEAMLSGCPIVASDVGSVGEVIGDLGILVKPNDPEGLAAGLLRILATAPDIRKHQTESARDRALRNFTISSFGRQFRNLYGELNHAPAQMSRTSH